MVGDGGGRGQRTEDVPYKHLKRKYASAIAAILPPPWGGKGVTAIDGLPRGGGKGPVTAIDGLPREGGKGPVTAIDGLPRGGERGRSQHCCCSASPVRGKGAGHSIAAIHSDRLFGLPREG
ncbi:hypothetical protein ACOMHN_002729 [Nucella lapillus]